MLASSPQNPRKLPLLALGSDMRQSRLGASYWQLLTIACADNIDYDDIKYFIKEHTTPGKGKTVSVPGRGDDKLAEFENALFHILADQHQRIDLFVRSKAGEIQRRLGKMIDLSDKTDVARIGFERFMSIESA
jgi:hypothetical protein